MVLAVLLVLTVPALAAEAGNVGEVQEVDVTEFTSGDLLDAIMQVSEIAPLADASSDYGLGTSYNELFAGVVGKLPIGTHYVYYRASDDVYELAYSDGMELSGDVFTAPSATVVTYNVSGGYGRPATFTVGTESGFTCDTGGYLVYSDLGSFPDLINREEVDYAALCCIILCSFALFVLFDRIVRACRCG